MPFTKSTRAMIDTRPRFIQREPEPGDPECACGDTFPAARAALGFDTCLTCAPRTLKLANMALHKQGATYTSNINVVRENQYGAHK